MNRLAASILASTLISAGCNSILNNQEGQLVPAGGGGGAGAGGGGAGAGGALSDAMDGPRDERGGFAGTSAQGGGGTVSTDGSAGTSGMGGLGGAGGRDSGPDGSLGTGGSAGPDGGGARDTGLDGSGGAGGALVEAGPDASPCGPGQKLCTDTCRPNNDPNLGCASASCSPCPTGPNGTPACVQGACGFTCTSGWGDCTAAAGCETSLRASPNCGACNTSCGSLVCGHSSMHCYDPKWADWPVPNSFASVPLPDGGVQNLPNHHSYDTTSTAGVVIDNVTHLEWQRVVDTTGGNGTGHYTYAQATVYCANLTLDNVTGPWRVPTRIELLSIVDTTVTAPTIDATAFPNTPVEFYWTSSLVAGNTSVAWDINFTNGFANQGDPVANTFNLVRCVR